MFSFASKSNKTFGRIKASFLLAIILISSIASLSFFWSNTASAAPTLSEQNSTNIDWQIKSIIYLYALNACANKDSNWMSSTQIQTYHQSKSYYEYATSYTTIDQVKSGDWFRTRPVRTLDAGVYIKDDFKNDPSYSKFFSDNYNWNGRLNCDSKILVSNALSLWQLDPITTLCNAGFKSIDIYNNDNTVNFNQSVDDCIKYANKPTATGLLYSPSGNDRSNNVWPFLDYIKKTVYGSTADPTLNTNVLKYFFYRHSLNESCIDNIDTTAPDEGNNVNTTKGYKDVKWLDLTTKNTIIGSYNGNQLNLPDSIINLGGIHDPIKLSCKNIVAKMNESIDGAKSWLQLHTGATVTSTTVTGATESDKTTTCAVDGIGWLVCPIVRVLSKAIDGSWGILKGFLQTSPNIVSTNGSTYEAWKIMRNIANAAFVVVFLIIIFSQITSFGINNYGIKKLLPKLIVSVLLVNLSFFICQIVVDLSNIIGYSMTDLFKSVSDQVTIVDTPIGNTGISKFGTLSDWIIGAAAGTGIAIYAGIGVLVPALLSAIVAVVMVLFLLIARQAVIVLLVVLSPLAFVASLLPNTEKLFKSWQKMLTSMLMLFPIIAVVVGASGLASEILSGVSQTVDTNGRWFGQIAAALVGVLPLFVIPGMLKKSMDGVGSIGKMINGVGDKWGKNAASKYTNSEFEKYRKQKKGIDTALTKAGSYTGKNPFRRGLSSINSGLNRSKVLNKINRGYGNAQAANGIKLAEAQTESEITAASSQLKFARLDKFQIRDLAQGKSINYIDANGNNAIMDSKSNNNLKLAAIRNVVSTNDVKGMSDLWDDSINWKGPEGQKQRLLFSDSLQASSNRPNYFTQGAIAKMRAGTIGNMTSDVVVDAIKNNRYSPSKIASADKDELHVVATIANTDARVAGTAEHRALQNNALEALTDPILSKQINQNIGHVTDIMNDNSPTDILA